MQHLIQNKVKKNLTTENPLVCSERVHMLQQGVGIYIASSEDVICGPHVNPNRNNIRNTTDATNMPPTSAYFMVDDRENNFKQGEKFSTPKILSVIRPLSSIDNEVSLYYFNILKVSKNLLKLSKEALLTR